MVVKVGERAIEKEKRERERERERCSAEKPVCVYKLRPRVIGACHRRQLLVRSFIVSVKKKARGKTVPGEGGSGVAGYIAYNGSEWPNYRAKFECVGRSASTPVAGINRGIWP